MFPNYTGGNPGIGWNADQNASYMYTNPDTMGMGGQWTQYQQNTQTGFYAYPSTAAPLGMPTAYGPYGYQTSAVGFDIRQSVPQDFSSFTQHSQNYQPQIIQGSINAPQQPVATSYQMENLPTANKVENPSKSVNKSGKRHDSEQSSLAETMEILSAYKKSTEPHTCDQQSTTTVNISRGNNDDCEKQRLEALREFTSLMTDIDLPEDEVQRNMSRFNLKE